MWYRTLCHKLLEKRPPVLLRYMGMRVSDFYMAEVFHDLLLKILSFVIGRLLLLFYCNLLVDSQTALIRVDLILFNPPLIFHIDAAFFQFNNILLFLCKFTIRRVTNQFLLFFTYRKPVWSFVSGLIFEGNLKSFILTQLYIAYRKV